MDQPEKQEKQITDIQAQDSQKEKIEEVEKELEQNSSSSQKDNPINTDKDQTKQLENQNQIEKESETQINNKTKIQFSQYIKILYKKYNKQVSLLCSLIFSFLTYYLYQEAKQMYTEDILIKCENDKPFHCLNNEIEPHMPTQISTLVYSSLYLLIPFLYGLLYINRINWIFTLVSLQGFYHLGFEIHGSSVNLFETNLQNMQPAITIGLLIFASFFLLFFAIVYFLYKLFRKFKLGTTIFLSVVIYFSYYQYQEIVNKCRKDFDYGLIEKLDKDGPYCEYDERTFCFANIQRYLFNFSKNEKCSLDTPDELQNAVQQWLINYEKPLDSNIRFIGWPSIKNVPSRIYYSQHNIAKHISFNSKSYKTKYQAIKDNKEIIIDVKNQKLHINIEKNEKIVQQREKIKNTERLSKNVVVMFIDTISREQFHNQLPKTREYLKKFANFDSQEYKQKKYNKKVFEFMRFHAVDRFTYNNAFVFNTNTTSRHFYRSLREKDKVFSLKNKWNTLFKEFKNAGYIVGNANNGQSKDYVIQNKYTWGGVRQHRYFTDTRADHEFQFFDPNYFSRNYSEQLNIGPNSIYRKCAYGHDTNYHLFQYAEKFFDAYKEEKKVMYFEFQDGHEPTGQNNQWLDENMHNYFKSLEDKGHLQDTIVYMFGDHGNHYRLMPLEYNNARAQDLMVPPMIMMIPNISLVKVSKKPSHFKIDAKNILKGLRNKEYHWKNRYLESVLKFNTQPAFTLWEVRRTILCGMNGLNFKDCQRSLFAPLNVENHCEDIGLVVKGKYCVCKAKNKQEEN